MTPIIVGIAGICLVTLLLVLGMPIALALISVGFIGIALLSGFNAALFLAPLTLFDEVASYPYMVIPLFILMGSLAGYSGMTKNIYSCLEKWLRPLPGGLAVAVIAACAAFASVSGSAIATTATLGSVTLPEMRRYGYGEHLSSGTIAAGGTLGFLIPPSLGFVVYGMLTEQSVGRLLVAGIIPGFLLAFIFSLVVLIWVWLIPQAAPKKQKAASLRERLFALTGLIEPAFLFVVVMSGIYGGVFTPTEAGAVGCSLLFLSTLCKRKLNWRNLKAALVETLKISVMTLFLVTGASIFTYFLALSTLPMQLSLWIGSLDFPAVFILLLLVLAYLLLGCFLDAISMMVLTLPVVLPVLETMQCDLIWFGVVAVLMMQAGLITPPLGLNLFTLSGVGDGIPVEIIFRGVLPFLMAIFIVVGLLFLYPEIATWLPDQML